MGIKFTVFSDLHYELCITAAGYEQVAKIEHIEEILDHAKETGAQFVMHCGDLSNHWPGYPELFEALLHNKHGLNIYGTYGNHDTQSAENAFSFVTPRLTNDPNVVWGTKDGKIGNGDVTYFYVDRDCYRFIFLDTNHSYFPKEGIIKHAPPGMGEAPAENIPRHVLGNPQLLWLKTVLDDAAEKGLHCITASHAGFGGFSGWEVPTPSYDIETIRELFNLANAKRPHTVIMSINGHYHNDHAAIADHMVFFSVNSCIAGWWDSRCTQTFVYDTPLYATVTITDNFEIIIEGKEGRWRDNLAPENEEELHASARIASRVFRLP